MSDISKVTYTISLNSKLVKNFRVYCTVNQIYQNEVLESLISNLLEPANNNNKDNILIIDKEGLSTTSQSILRGVADPLSIVNQALEHFLTHVKNLPTIDSQEVNSNVSEKTKQELSTTLEDSNTWEEIKEYDDSDEDIEIPDCFDI